MKEADIRIESMHYNKHNQNIALSFLREIFTLKK